MTREQERQELYKTIWSIANDLRGSVDGWDFKAYVLGMLAYRYLSESLAGELNRGEREAGAVDFDYARQDECLEGQDRLNFVQNRGYYIEPGLLFENVMQCGDDVLNEKLDAALRQIEASGEGTGAAKMFEGLFTDMDLNSNKLGASTGERNRRLKKLMASIGSLKLGTYMTDRVGSIGRMGGVGNSVDIFGDAYEYLMTMYAANAGKSGGEYFTPPEVSELLARIVTENGTKTAPRGNGAVVNTTEDLFGPLLHSYVITDAIRDKTVLRFKIGYMNTAKIEDGVGDDEEVEGAAFEKTAMQPERIGAICDYIVNKFDQKTHRKQDLKFNSILACYDIEAATRYYKILKEKLQAVGRDDIKIAIIYTYGANDEILEYAGMSKEQFLGLAMQDYNTQFATRFTLDDYKAYNDDISCRMKGRRPGAGAIMRDEMLDILIVADMYLTGFDSQYVNTLWVDKPLKYHALIQAFSRTNRTFGPNKPCGEIVCFRNLKSAVDTAISLFASVDGRTGVLVCRTYEDYYNGYGDGNGKWSDGYAKLVDTLMTKFDYQHMTQDTVGESEQAAFVKLFGQILVSRNLLNTFDEFAGNEILTQRQFDDYKGWYLHLHDTMGKGRAGLDNGDILDGLEFHVELVSEETVGIDGILERIRREAGKDTDLPGSVISADALVAIQSAVDASVAMRKKKRLLQLFLAQVNNGGDASGEAFLALASEAYDKAVRDAIAGLKLRDGADEFIKRCVESGCVLETGSGLDAILPPVRRFCGGGHGIIREQVVEKIQVIVDEFEGLDVKF